MHFVTRRYTQDCERLSDRIQVHSLARLVPLPQVSRIAAYFSALAWVSLDCPDYRRILALCREGKERLDQIKRFDMPGFRPRPSYVREMKKYEILPKDLPANAQIDVYATDRAYWRSLWWQPDDGVFSTE